MNYYIDLKSVKKKQITRLSDQFYGEDMINGRELSFTNYYMQMDGKPFMGISGECHFSRVQENQWEDTILKMKMGGINIIAAYVFWIHHEEVEGRIRFDGNRNLRKFAELCKKHNLYLIVRIGPFNHGECRNGGLPDWLYGKPFEVRGDNEGFLACTRRWFQAIGEQLDGLYFKDGGPVIAAQIENEYMHSAAPWELTTGVSNEWLPGGTDGERYMKKIKILAQEAGIITPFYTCTGWGGATTPTDEMLPLWGGYAFWPWIYYDYEGEHPLTPEYIYRDNHNNDVPETYNFVPTYEPENFPYSCCEMGGGMTCMYRYRFQLPYESVDAMANIKLAGGCNFLGYYMYRGGSNPRGEKTPYLNEGQCPKISYDYQAPIGEFGQLRPSYYRLKALHLFMKNYQEQFCRLTTVLPEGSQDIQPEDVDTLRFAVRSDGKSGFLFLNNYQDHAVCKDKKQETVVLELTEKCAGKSNRNTDSVHENIVFSDISLAAGENAILPFNLDIEGYRLIYAKAQPLSVIRENECITYFFFMPEGMKPEYMWDGTGIRTVKGNSFDRDSEGKIIICPDENGMSSFEIDGTYGKVEIVTLTREQSLNFYEIEKNGRRYAVMCSSSIVFDGEKLLLENPQNGEKETVLLSYPKWEMDVESAGTEEESVTNGRFEGIRIHWPESVFKEYELLPNPCGFGRYTIHIPDDLDTYKDAVLQIYYRGDVGHLFQDGVLLSDNFSNEAVWEVGLHEVWETEKGKELTILITPRKKNAVVDVSSTMAGRTEQLSGAVAELYCVKIRKVSELSVK